MSLCALFVSPLHADRRAVSEEVYDFDIPRTTRLQALQELSRQAGGLLLGYLSNDDEEEQALVGPVKGRHTVEGVLRVILRSAMLTYRWVEKDILAVEPIKLRETTGLEAELLRAPDERAWREEITVVSWALREFMLSVPPAAVLDRDRIDAIGAPTLAEALRYVSQSAYTRPEGYRLSGAQYAEMRGLGPDTALVLINGRRTLPSANSINSSAFDLNTIPITAVERVELWFDSHAAAYGTDAIGGIVNIVLRDHVSDPLLDVRYGAADGGAEQRRATFSAGTNGRFHSALILDYFDLGGLEGSDRDLWRDQNYGRFGGRDHRSIISGIGNISSATGAALPGLSSPIAAVPLADPTPGVSRDDFVDTAGRSNLESLFRYWSVVPKSTRASAVGTGSFDINERLTLSAEVLYVDRESTFYFFPPALPGVPVPASNAYNPFGTTVIASRLLAGFEPQYRHIESDLRRAVIALDGGWGAWKWGLSAMDSKEEAVTAATNELDLRPDGPVMAALASADPARALNPFQSGPIGSPELLSGLFAPSEVDHFSSAGRQLAGFVTGPVAQLWGGPMRLTAGGESRRESAEFSSAQASFDQDRDITSGFLQLQIPLIKPGKRAWGAAHELSLSAGWRWDDYDVIGSGVRWQYGAQWKPRPSFTVRGSTGRSFRPPSLYELYLPQLNQLARVSDPARGNETTSVRVSIGGNDELQPVTAETVTGGIEFRPDTAMNWLLSADYWRVTMDERILLLPAPLLLAHESLFADRIERAEPTVADIQAQRPGRVHSIDGSRINAGRVEASGVDFRIRTDFQTAAGRFTPELLATWFDKYLATDVRGRPALDRVDVAHELGTILEWRAILSLGWKRGPYGLTAAARYTPSYDDAVAGVRVGRKIASQTLFDLQASLDFSRLLGTASPWAGFKLTAGANNLFDEEPSFAIAGDAAGFDMSQGDLKQRSYYLRLQKSF